MPLDIDRVGAHTHHTAAQNAVANTVTQIAQSSSVYWKLSTIVKSVRQSETG